LTINKVKRYYTLFTNHAGKGVTVLLFCVDDIIVIGNDEKEKEDLKQRLVRELELKELLRLKYILGIEVAYSNHEIFISQQKYITNLVVVTGKLGCRPVSTPMDPNHKLCQAEEESAIEKKMYQRLVVKLFYLADSPKSDSWE